MPELGRAFAARSQGFKLVRPEGKEQLELYDMVADPFELRDLAADRPEVVDRLDAAYRAWFEDVRRDRNFAPPRIVVGSPHEPTTTLTRQDWRGPRAGWTPESLGHWDVQVARAGRYDVTLHFPAVPAPTAVHLAIGDARPDGALEAGAVRFSFADVPLAAGPARLEAWIDREQGEPVGVSYVEVRRRD